MGSKGGGNVEFPSPYEVGHAQTQFNWQDQYTPYGGLVYNRPQYNPQTGQASGERRGIPVDGSQPASTTGRHDGRAECSARAVAE